MREFSTHPQYGFCMANASAVLRGSSRVPRGAAIETVPETTSRSRPTFLKYIIFEDLCQ